MTIIWRHFLSFSLVGLALYSSNAIAQEIPIKLQNSCPGADVIAEAIPYQQPDPWHSCTLANDTTLKAGEEKTIKLIENCKYYVFNRLISGGGLFFTPQPNLVITFYTTQSKDPNGCVPHI